MTRCERRIKSGTVALAQTVRYPPGAGTIRDAAGQTARLLPRDEHAGSRSKTGHRVDHRSGLVRRQVRFAATARCRSPRGRVLRERVTRSRHAFLREDAARKVMPQTGHRAAVRWPRAPFVARSDFEASRRATDPRVPRRPVFAQDRRIRPKRCWAELRGWWGQFDDARVHGDVITNLPFVARHSRRAPAMARGHVRHRSIGAGVPRRIQRLLRNEPVPELAL